MVQVKSSLFWDVTQHRVIVIYWHFGTTYWSHLQQSCSPRRFFLDCL